MPHRSFPDAADLAAAYTRRTQLDDGLFAYEYDFRRREWSTKNNIVRQAGATFALAAYAMQRDHEETRACVERALAALSKLSVGHEDGLLVSGEGTLGSVKTGTTALVLAAATLVDSRTAPRDGWLAGLLGLQRDDGSFRKSPQSPERLGYYDGEAWFCLALVAATRPSPELLVPLLRCDEGLVATYGEAADITFYHWGQLAAAARYGTTRDPAFIEFSARQTQSLLDDVRPQSSLNSSSCYMLEGLAASYLLISKDPDHAELAERVRRRIEVDLAHNRGLQITRSRTKLRRRNGKLISLRDPLHFEGAVLNGVTRLKTRVDTTQHCLAAFLQLSALGVDLGMLDEVN